MGHYLNEAQLADPTHLPQDAENFLRWLGGPSWFRVPGTDTSRCRAVVTLLHGNEPSGTLALLRLLRQGERPAVTLLCCVVTTDAALTDPVFSQRALPGVRDQNRCFLDQIDDRPGRIAAEIRALMEEAKPECIVDLHNTSGSGPAYGVAADDSSIHRALTSLWSNHMMHTGLRLGTLIEGLSNIAPCITLECGGRCDAASHEIAYQGLLRYAAGDAIDEPRGPVEVHHHPVRVELVAGCHVAYDLAPSAQADVTLRPDVDAHNFSIIKAGTKVAWLGPRGLAALCVKGENQLDRTLEFFEAVGNELRAKVAFKPLMVTTNAAIAESDCLFYAVALVEEHQG